MSLGWQAFCLRSYNINYYESTCWNPCEYHGHSTTLIITRAGLGEQIGRERETFCKHGNKTGIDPLDAMAKLQIITCSQTQTAFSIYATVQSSTWKTFHPPRLVSSYQASPVGTVFVMFKAPLGA